MTEFAMNNAVHASTGLTPFFVNNARHPRIPALLGLDDSSTLVGGGTPDVSVSRQTSSETLHDSLHVAQTRSKSQITPSQAIVPPHPVGVRLSDSKLIDEFVTHRQSVARFVRVAIAAAVDKQKASADQRGRKNLEKF